MADRTVREAALNVAGAVLTAAVVGGAAAWVSTEVRFATLATRLDAIEKSLDEINATLDRLFPRQLAPLPPVRP